MPGFATLLAEKKVVLTDGAWGTELAKLGTDDVRVPEALNTVARDTVLAVARSYVEAGSDIILTNTFGGSRMKLAKAALEKRCTELNRAGAAISKEAAGADALVFGSVGPTGEFLAPLGVTTIDQMIDVFTEQIAALLAGGVDGLVIETMTDLNELSCAVSAARKVAPHLPLVACMTFDKGPAGFATMMGVTVEKFVGEMEALEVEVIGSNCGSGFDTMLEIAKIARPLTERPLWFKANAGLPELVDGETVFRETPADTAAKVVKIKEAGAKFIGGCCGTTPAHLRAMAAALR